jgi:putative transposase
LRIEVKDIILKLKIMGNTYTQLHVQFVFAVKYRAAMIDAGWQARLHQYMTGIVQSNKHKMLQVNSMPDHIHLLVGLRPHQAISALMQNVKSESTKWIKEQGFCKLPFAWQEGYGAFSYSQHDVPKIIRYIQNQPAHHSKEPFLDEYRRLLKECEIAFEEAYIFGEPQ